MAKEDAKRRRIYKILLFLPYFVGIFWTCLHPIASVLTGELKCRGWFLDENAIETRFATQQSQSTIRLPDGSSTLCETLSNQARSNVWCSSKHANSFDIAVLVPLSNAIDPTDEAIVLIVPAPPDNDNWHSSSFHYSLTQSMNKLADPMATPWLSKTVILVSPSQTVGSKDEVTLEETVSTFLDAYLGSKSMDTAIAPLPPRYCQAILRNMIVVDLQDELMMISSTARRPDTPPPQTDLSVLPQGKRGALPNLDMVTLVGKLYQQASFLNTRAYPSATFLAHGYTQQSKDMKHFISQTLLPETPSTKFGKKAQTWANEMVDLGLFAYTLAAGPYPPHWPALDRGIDSLTLQVSFEGLYYRKDPSLETVQILENIVRALSNLHERLHHSFVLYWLPSPEKFVSHMEYFLPAVLVLLPLATRAFGMLFMGDLTALHLTTIGKSFLVSICSIVYMALASLLFTGDGDTTMWTNTCLLVLYGVVAVLWQRAMIVKSDAEEDSNKRRIQSLQFAACATAAYLLVPIAFCHSALVYIPGMVLVPLLAFPDYSCQFGKIKRMTFMALWILTAPPLLLVPRFFPSYTIFVSFAYIPMHIQLLLLIFLSS